MYKEVLSAVLFISSTFSWEVKNFITVDVTEHLVNSK